VLETRGERVHCLNYWSIIDSIMPRESTFRAASAEDGGRRIP
jgi:hypothetical protein